jgi:hypothetical protein
VEPTGFLTELAYRWLIRFAETLDEILARNDETDTAQTELIATLNETVDRLDTVVAQLTAQREMERSRDSEISGLTITPGTNDIVISSHSRSYLDPTNTVSVTGDTISGLASATTYYVHYTDDERAGGAVGYQVSDTLEGATATLTEPYRHFVGVATTGGSATNAPSPYWRLGL